MTFLIAVVIRIDGQADGVSFVDIVGHVLHVPNKGLDEGQVSANLEGVR